jgi:phosphohistidine phosphatase
MKLYLIRHATAADVAASDAERELTKEGRHEAKVAGKALVKLGVAVDQVLTSPLVRARQTAEIIAGPLGLADRVAVLTELGNAHTTSALLRALGPWAKAQGLLLVGHMPSLADHLNLLIGAGMTANVSFGKGTVVAVRLAQLRVGGGELHCFMRQKQLAAIAGEV